MKIYAISDITALSEQFVSPHAGRAHCAGSSWKAGTSHVGRAEATRLQPTQRRSMLEQLCADLQEERKAGLYVGPHIGDMPPAGAGRRAGAAAGGAAVGAGAHAVAGARPAPAHTG